MLSGPGAGPAPVINDVMGTEDVTVGTTGIRILSCGCGGQGLDILKMLEEGETCALALGVTFVMLGLTNSGRMRPWPGLAVRNLAGLGEAAAVGDLHLLSLAELMVVDDVTGLDIGRNTLCWVGLNMPPSPGVVLLDPDMLSNMVAASILAAS